MKATSLQALPEIQVLSPLVTRVLGLNPGPYTLTGTNTYLVGRGRARALVDSGEGGSEAYLHNLGAAMAQAGCERISHLILTHFHHDHVGGAAEVVGRFGVGAVLKFPLPLAVPPAVDGSGGGDAEADDDAAAAGKDLGVDARGEAGGVAFEPLVDGADILIPLEEVAGAGADGAAATAGAGAATLRVVHTPGHTQDHICLQLLEEGSLFSADCVLGGSTAVFEDLASYMGSRRKLLLLAEGQQQQQQQQQQQPGQQQQAEGAAAPAEATVGMRIYPGHGPVIDDGGAAIGAYIEHRNARERQILQTMREANGGVGGSGGGGGSADGGGAPVAAERSWTAMQLVEVIYRESTPQYLWPAAAGNVTHHMSKLRKEGAVVEAARQPSGEPAWALSRVALATDGARL